MKKLINLVAIILILVSCTEIPHDPIGSTSFGGGVFILNEGNYNGGNGSLSFYSYDSSKVFNDLFGIKNGRPLGDVPNSMTIKADKAYIIVNNSGKIEVINNSSLESVATITGLIAPRYMSVINDYKAYVTSIYSDSLIIIDLTSNKISGYINLRRSSEAIAISGNKAFVSNWVGGKEIMVINTLNNTVIDSIEVGIEPESMVIDRNQSLWVLCNGGWMRENFAELVKINSVTHHVEKTYTFPSKLDSPGCLQIDGFGQTLFYLDKGVRYMDINSQGLPYSALIPESGSYFYKIGINPVNSDIFITDAVDYTQRGYVLLYKNDGKFVSKERADIIPGSFCFKLRYNSQSI